MPLLFDTQVLLDAFPAILSGLLCTVLLSFVSTVLATFAGGLSVFFQKSALTVLRGIAHGYTHLFRNTPLLVQLYFFYQGLPFIGLKFSAMTCGILALSLQSGAYFAEIFRAGLESIPREQLDSGASLGLSRVAVYTKVILPQALLFTLPAYTNQVVSLTKNSSLVAFITVTDLFAVVFRGSVAQLRYLEFFCVGLLAYMGLTLMITFLFLHLEKWLAQKWPGVQETYAV